MTEAETIELYEATDGNGRGLQNVFILGSLCDRNEQIAVSRQQVRALNLVHSLLDRRRGAPRLASGSRLCVVGAGAAGLTAAALAHHHGVRVTVLESRGPLWNLRGCRTRWLHPNLFALWPNDGWDVTATDFPVMNWHADYAYRVGELLWAKYKSYVPAGQRPWVPILLGKQHAVNVSAKPLTAEGHAAMVLNNLWPPEVVLADVAATES